MNDGFRTSGVNNIRSVIVKLGSFANIIIRNGANRCRGSDFFFKHTVREKYKSVSWKIFVGVFIYLIDCGIAMKKVPLTPSSEA